MALHTRTKRENLQLEGDFTSKKWLFFTTSIGIFFLVIPLFFIFGDPTLMLVKHVLRLGKGAYLYNLMLSKLDGPKIYVSLFNITNGKEYVSGDSNKIKLEEIGPFVFQEYRLIEDLSIDSAKELMTYTPKVWAEFIPEESIADPKDVRVTMPSIPMLQGADMMAKYSFFWRNMFNMVAASIRSKAIVNITAHEYLFGYPEPLINLANSAVPGFFYYNSSGIMERLYDVGAKYRIELGTKDVEKFSIKKATKFRDNIIDSVTYFKNAYEGAAFPPGMTPETPVYIYRHSVCKVFKMQHTGSKTTEYGSEAFTYDISNDTLKDHELCLENGKWCPDGIISIAPCFLNLPFALSRGHFLDADPRILDRYEGLKPDRRLHSSEIVVDPKVGVTLTSTVSIQLNLALGDIGYNAETRPFKNTVLPICHARLKHPKLPALATAAFSVLYTYRTYILLTITAVCLLAGLTSLAYSVKHLYWINVATKQTFVYETSPVNKSTDAYFPLIL